MSEPLAGRHAIVTGGSRGIGAAIAAALTTAGARVTLLGRDAGALAKVAKPLRGASALVCDITDATAVARAFVEAGSADILVNNAGAAESAPFERTDAALWQRMLAVNLTGAYHCTQATLPTMRAKKWGRIVNIASTAAHQGFAYVTAYCAAKHGLLGLTRALALEVARDGVTVNAVCPGFTETDLLAASLQKITAATGRSEAEARKMILRDSGQSRFTTPEEVAAVVVRLCLPESSSINGQSLPVEPSSS